MNGITPADAERLNSLSRDINKIAIDPDINQLNIAFWMSQKQKFQNELLSESHDILGWQKTLANSSDARIYRLASRAYMQFRPDISDVQIISIINDIDCIPEDNINRFSLAWPFTGRHNLSSDAGIIKYTPALQLSLFYWLNIAKHASHSACRTSHLFSLSMNLASFTIPLGIAQLLYLASNTESKFVEIIPRDSIKFALETNEKEITQYETQRFLSYKSSVAGRYFQ